MRSIMALLALLMAMAVCANADVRLQSVDRKIVLQTQFVKISENIKLKNSQDEPLEHVILCTSYPVNATVGVYKVTEGPKSKSELLYTPTHISQAPPEASCFSVTLSQPLAAGETAGLNTLLVLANAQIPYPAQVLQGEAQLMVFTSSVYVLSPYQVSAQTTEVLTQNGNIKSYTDEKPVSKSDNRITYGRYEIIKPFTVKELRVHYENTQPFKNALSLVKEVEVSHWGNIYVEEKYELKNNGAKHRGPFSRLKYAYFNGKTNSFRDLKARLPLEAHSLYYVDLIGNISTSNTRKTAIETVIDFETRYPVMGGWKVDFTLGYSLPLTKSLFIKKKDRRYRLTIPFLGSVEDVFVEQHEIRVVLPEGSTALTFKLPYGVERSDDVKYTYLDTTGRPVLVLRKTGVVPEHATALIVEYAYPPLALLREPTLLVVAFLAIFAALILYNRLEFTISKDERWQEEQRREKISAAMQSIRTLFDDMERVLVSVQKLADGISDWEEGEAALKTKGEAEAKLKELEGSVLEQAKVLELNAKVAAQIRELIEKAKAALARSSKNVAERTESLRKGMPYAEAVKKHAAAARAAVDARKEFEEEVESVFAPY